MHAALETLINAAILAPSGDNTQPWRFLIDDDEMTIDIQVDDTRDISPMNAGQRMARIACGAALENMAVTAGENQWGFDLQKTGESYASLQRVRLCASASFAAGVIPDILGRRVTNRRFYGGGPLGHNLIALIDGQFGIDGVSVQWRVERHEFEKVGFRIGEADGMMFGITAMREAFLDKVRFDLAADTPAEEGLPVGAISNGLADHIALRALRRMPPAVVRLCGIPGAFRRRAIQLVKSASGICVVTAPDDSPATDFAVGRVFQRVWLAMTNLGLAVQPMMSLPVLDNWIRFGTGDRRGVEELTLQTRETLCIDSGKRIAAIFRFGHATAPACRTGRRPASAVVCCRDGRESTAVDAA